MPRYVARNYLNELLQSLQSDVGCLLISEDIPRVGLAAHDAAPQLSLVSTSFVSSHPWLQDKIDFNGLNFTEIQISEEVQHLSMNSRTSTNYDFFESSSNVSSAPCGGCCCNRPVAQHPQVHDRRRFHWMDDDDDDDDVKKNANDGVMSPFVLEDDLLMDSHGNGRAIRTPPVSSQLVRRLKPAVVSDPLFDQTTIQSETLIFRDEFASVNPLLQRMHNSDDCIEPCAEDECHSSGISQQNLVLEEPMTLHRPPAPFDGPRQLLLRLLSLERDSLLDEQFSSSSSSAEAVGRGAELINCAAGVEREEQQQRDIVAAAPIEFLNSEQTTSEEDQLAIIVMHQLLGIDAVHRHPFLLLESPLLKSCTAHPSCCASFHPSDLVLEKVVEEEEEKETIAQLLMLLCESSDGFWLSRLSEANQMSDALWWQNEKYFDEIQLLAVRECPLQSVTTCDDSLQLTSVWSTLDTLSLMPEEITTSQELEMAWDPLQASYGLMAATERHSIQPVVQLYTSPHSASDCRSAVVETHQWSAEEEEEEEEVEKTLTTISSTSRAHHHQQQQQQQSPFPHISQAIEILQKTNAQNDFAEAAGHGVYSRHVDDFSRKRHAPPPPAASSSSSSVTDTCSSRSCPDNMSLQLLDPLDQFLMLRNAHALASASSSKGPAVVTGVDSQARRGGGPSSSSSSLVAIVQPCVNTAATAAIETSSSIPVQVRTVLEASSPSSLAAVFPFSSSSCLEAESRNITNLSTSTVINIPLTAPPVESLLRLIEETAHPFLALLRRHNIIVGEESFNSLHSNVTGFIVKQQQHDFSSSSAPHPLSVADGDDVQLRVDLLRAAVCVHCLVSAHEYLMHSSLSSAAHVLSTMKARHQQIIGSLLENVQQRLLLEQVHLSKDGILHPKVLEICRLIRLFNSTYSRRESKSKILVILPACDGRDVSLMSVGHDLLEILNSVEETRPTLLSSSLFPTDLNKCDAYNCYLVSSNHLTDEWPWTDFALVIEYTSSLTSANKEKCLRVNVPFVGLQSINEMRPLTLDDDENYDDVAMWRCRLQQQQQQVSIVMSHDVTAKHKQLIHLLETRYNVVVTERDYASLMGMSGYFEDVTVDGSTVIIIEDLMVLRRKQEMERLVMRVSGLKQKSVACWILVFSNNNRSTSDQSSDFYSTNVIINISKLQASFGVLAEPDFQIKVIFCHSYNSMAMRIRQIASDALSRKDSSSSDGQTQAAASSVEPTQDECFLLAVPCLNSIRAQMFLRIGSLKALLTMSRSELVERSSSSMPIKILQTFLEFRESVGEIFLILRHAQCVEYGQRRLLANRDGSSSPEKNPCHWSPTAGTTTTGSAGWSMQVDRMTEGMMDREEQELRNDDAPFKTRCLSSSKLNDFQEAEIREQNFNAFLASLKSHLADEKRLETEEEEDKDRFAVQFDCREFNPVHAQSVEIEDELDFSFTDSATSTRIPLMLRNESKWRSGDHVLHWDDLALSANAAAAADALAGDNFQTYNEQEQVPMTTNCHSVNSIGSTTTPDVVMRFKTISSNSSRSPINCYSCTDKPRFPLGRRHPFMLADEEADTIDDDCDKAIGAEDRFVPNDHELEAFFQPLHLHRTTILNDGLDVATGRRAQVELDNTPIPNDGIGNMPISVDDLRMMYTRGNDREVDPVDCRQFRQPVLSLTLDVSNCLDQKSKRNSRSHARAEQSFGYRWLSQRRRSSPPAPHGSSSSLRKRKLTFERDDATKNGQTKLKFI